MRTLAPHARLSPLVAVLMLATLAHGQEEMPPGTGLLISTPQPTTEIPAVDIGAPVIQRDDVRKATQRLEAAAMNRSRRLQETHYRWQTDVPNLPMTETLRADPPAHARAMPLSPRRNQATITFDQPAHFHLSDFESSSTGIASELDIFEGMEITFVRDGRYEIRFETSTPRVPVQGHLRFHLSRPGQPDQLLFTLAFSLAAPPEIYGRLGIPGRRSLETRPVVKEGYSGQVQVHFDELQQMASHQNRPHVHRGEPTAFGSLRRSGSAVFGYGSGSLR